MAHYSQCFVASLLTPFAPHAVPRHSSPPNETRRCAVTLLCRGDRTVDLANSGGRLSGLSVTMDVTKASAWVLDWMRYLDRAPLPNCAGDERKRH